MSETTMVWIAKPLADAAGILYANQRRKGRGYQAQVEATNENYTKVGKVKGFSVQRTNATRTLELALIGPVAPVAVEAA